MRIEKITKKIEQELNLAKGLQNINLHIPKDFSNEKDNPYIEFKVQNEKAGKRASKLYSKWSKIIRKNYPEITVEYNNPHPFHNNDYLRRIIISINKIRDPRDKKELLTKAAECFYQILKSEIKYQK